MFERPTLNEIYQNIQADIKAKMQGVSGFLRRSVLQILAKVYAGACHLLYGFLIRMKDQIFISRADEDNLEIHGNEYGVYRKAANKASGTGTASGTIGITIPIGTELKNADDYIYTVDSDFIIGSGGTVEISFTAEVAGTESNDVSGLPLTFISPIAGVNTSVTVGINGIDGGTDEEDVEDYRSRVLSRKRYAPHGGSENDYVNWALEVSGVTRAWTIPQYYGYGTVGLIFVRDNDASIIPSESEKEAVRAYLISHTDTQGQDIGIPVGATPGLIMVNTQLHSLYLTVKILPNTSSVQAAVITAINNLLLSKGAPGGTLYLSGITEAISSVGSEIAHKIVSPTEDIGIAIDRVPVLGGIIFQDYV